MTPTDKVMGHLAKLGFEVRSTGDVWAVQGGQRRQDVVRWNALARYQGRPIILCSWDTLTKCARNGIRVEFYDGDWHVWAKEKMEYISWWVRDKETYSGVSPTIMHARIEGANKALCGRVVPTDRGLTYFHFFGTPRAECPKCRKIEQSR